MARHVSIHTIIKYLSKMSHQMWHNHPFSENNKPTKRAVVWRLWRGEAGQNLKRGLGDSRGLHKIGGVRNPLPTMPFVKHELKSLINEPACYKNPLYPSCIDLFLNNDASSLQRTLVVETEFSDFHKLVVAMIKSHILKQKPNNSM